MSTAIGPLKAPGTFNPQPAKKPVWKRWWLWLASVLALFGLIGALTGGNQAPTAIPEGPAVTTPQPETSASSAPAASTPPASQRPTPGTTNATPSPPPPARGTALAALATLKVKGRAPETGYAREQFGPAWADVDRNGCDTRNDILRRDLSPYLLKAGTNGCLVLEGVLHDPYTGTTIDFVRGTGASSQVQIDHVVALSDAWQKGASQLNVDLREKFANDPLNLVAVSTAVNEAKHDGDAATWLPPNKGYRCAYVARQVAVKARYNLWVTAAEKTAIANVLGACLGQKLPTSSSIPLGGGTVISPPSTPAPTRPPAPSPTPAQSGLDPRFATCKAAKAAGYGPYYEGKDPEYGWYRDSDNDGVVCE